MAILHTWAERLKRLPQTIECYEMILCSFDDKIIVKGSGFLEIRDAEDIGFTILVSPSESNQCFLHIAQAVNNPFECEKQLKLMVTDYEGYKWSGGWITFSEPLVIRLNKAIKGRLVSLSMHDKGGHLPSVAGVELVFDQEVNLPIALNMSTITTIGDEVISQSREKGDYSLKVFDSEIIFSYFSSSNYLLVQATTCEELPHPYLENWLSEPLRILFGMHIYPRLVARHLGNGESIICLRPTVHRRFSASEIGLYWAYKDTVGFWSLYSGLLKYMSISKDDKGERCSDANEITELYEHAVVAEMNGEWMLSMVLSNAVESMVKKLKNSSVSQQDSNNEKVNISDAVSSLKKYIHQWDGDPEIRRRVLGFVSNMGDESIKKFLKKLVRDDIIKEKHEEVWSKVRNHVMHGNLQLRWEPHIIDQYMRSLLEMIHILTFEILRQERVVPVASFEKD
jgi:hypothetical protein